MITNLNVVGCGDKQNNVVKKGSENTEKCVFISQIPHIRQRFSYDCGLTCIRMSVRYCVSNIQTEQLETVLEKNDRKQGLWSIDLAFILHELGVQTAFYTKMLGADENYANTTYYASSFVKDENRVNELFQMAEQKGMTVFRKSISLEQILKHLNQRLPVIVLVNANKLRCKHCENCFSITVKQLMYHFYQGHYIVLVGYDALSDSVLYRDPGSRDTLCSTSLNYFECARKSTGTDEDVLFLFSDCARF